MAQKRQKQYDTDTIEPREKGGKDACSRYLLENRNGQEEEGEEL